MTATRIASRSKGTDWVPVEEGEIRRTTFGMSVLTDPDWVPRLRQWLTSLGYAVDETPELTHGEAGLICLLLGYRPRRAARRR